MTMKYWTTFEQLVEWTREIALSTQLLPTLHLLDHMIHSGTILIIGHVVRTGIENNHRGKLLTEHFVNALQTKRPSIHEGYVAVVV